MMSLRPADRWSALSDDRNDLAKVLEGKIDMVPEVSKIYRRYVSRDRVLSSLSSSEGSAMMIHLAYYFSKLDDAKRNAVLKMSL